MKNRAEEVVQQLIRYKNGVTADSMAEKGLHYELNYGASVVDILAVAKQYAPDQALAFELFKRPEREAKLAAIYIIDLNKLTDEDIRYLSTLFVNEELVEQICLRLTYKHTNALRSAFDWCKSSNPYIQKAGWLTLGRAAGLPNIPEGDIELFLPLIYQADFTSVQVRSALVYALPKIAAKSAGLREKIEAWAKRTDIDENTEQQKVANEVLAFLTIL